MLGLALFRRRSLYANVCNDYSVPYFTAAISRTDPFDDIDESELRYLPGQTSPVILDTTQWSLQERVIAREARNCIWSNLSTYAALTILVPLCLPPLLANSMYQTYRSERRLGRHQRSAYGYAGGRYQDDLLQVNKDLVQSLQTDDPPGNKCRRATYLLPTPPQSPTTLTLPPLASSGSIDEGSTSGPGSDDICSSLTNLKEPAQLSETSLKPHFALTEERVHMCDSLDRLGFDKFPVRIRKTRFAHAAIIARESKAKYAEGKMVCVHWADRFEA